MDQKLIESIFQGFSRERQHSQVTGAFDGVGQAALVPGAGARLAPWADLAIFGYEAAQNVHLLVINGDILSAQNWQILGRATYLRPEEGCSFSPTDWSFMDTFSTS